MKFDAQGRLIIAIETATGEVSFTGVVQPPILGAGQTDDWNVSLVGISRIRVSCPAGASLTGLVAIGVSDGRIIVLTNVGSESLIIRNKNTGSAAANRFAMNGDLILPVGASVWFIRDSVVNMWSKMT